MLDFMSVASRQRRLAPRSVMAAVAASMLLLAAMPWTPGVSLVGSATAQSAATEPRLKPAQRELLAARLADRLKVLKRDVDIGHQRVRKLVDNWNGEALEAIFDANATLQPLPDGSYDHFHAAIKDYVSYEDTFTGVVWNPWPEGRDPAYQKDYANCVLARANDFFRERQDYSRAIIDAIKKDQPPPKLADPQVDTSLSTAVRAALTSKWYPSGMPISFEIPDPDRSGLKPEEKAIFNLRRTCPIRPEDPGEREPRSVGKVALNVGWSGRCLQTDKENADGTAGPYHPTTASLMYDDGRTGLTAYCSGTLIAPNAVLTAAHCICDTRAKDGRGQLYPAAGICANGGYSRVGRWMSTLAPANQTVFLQHAGHFDIDRIVVHPQFRWTDLYPVSDLAIVFLKEPVRAIKPMQLNTLGRVRPNTSAAAVGYGAHNPIDATGKTADTTKVEESTGLKLQANTVTGFCSFIQRARNHICWQYKTTDRFGMQLGSTCRGDSGGPLYADSRGQTYLVGVTSGGGPSCQPSSSAFDIEVFAYRDWIKRQLLANPPPAGNGVSSGRGAPEEMRQVACHFCPMCDSLTGTINVPSKARYMRISVNCTPDDVTRPSELQLQVSATEDGEDNLCRKDGTSVLESSNGTTALTCVVDELKADQKRLERLHVKLNSGLLQQCQIVATAYEQRN